MGGTNFWTMAAGVTIGDAFRQAQEHEAWEHGHGGYTGTIAEKPGVIEFPPLPARWKADQLETLIWDAQSEWDYLTNTEKPANAKRRNAIKRLEDWLKTPVETYERPLWAFANRSRDTERKVTRKRTVTELLDVYNSKWDEAVGFEVKGQQAVAFKKRHGLAGTRKKVYVFTGIASC